MSSTRHILRWLLMLALTFVQISAPFHRHQHDGVDAAGVVIHRLATSDAMPQLQGAAPLIGSHALMSIPVDASRSAQLLGAEPLEAAAMAVAMRWHWMAALPAIDEPPAVHRARDLATLQFRLHRSVPPAGRAPPRTA